MPQETIKRMFWLQVSCGEEVKHFCDNCKRPIKECGVLWRVSVPGYSGNRILMLCKTCRRKYKPLVKQPPRKIILTSPSDRYDS